MDTKKLRQKILDLAIRGKLVPQDPNDEPASVLLERIRKEKERLIKEGKIKRNKKEKTSDTSHYQNLPFELPQGWIWESVGNLCSTLQYGTSEKSSSEGKIAVLRMGNITHLGELNYDDLVFTSNDDDIAKYTLISRDLLFNRTNSSEWVGKTAIYRGEIPAIYAGYIIRFRPILLNLEYVNHVMNSGYEKEYCQSVKTDGVNQSNINSQKLAKFLIPIPPLQEQLRIVSKIREIFISIERLEENKLSLKQFIKQAKSKLLDLAIRGKLVPQDTDDEPASVLLERIRNKHDEKKSPSDISYYPFEIPKSWVWAYGYECFNPMGNKRPTGETFRYIDINSIDNKKHIITEARYLNVSDAPSRASRSIDVGDTLFSMVRPYLKNIAYIDEDYYNCIASTGFFVCKPNRMLYPKYLYYLMLSSYVIDGLNNFMKGDNSPSINNINITSFLYPIPPLTEQNRIVGRIETIFQVLDTISNNL